MRPSKRLIALHHPRLLAEAVRPRQPSLAQRFEAIAVHDARTRPSSFGPQLLARKFRAARASSASGGSKCAAGWWSADQDFPARPRGSRRTPSAAHRPPSP